MNELEMRTLDAAVELRSVEEDSDMVEFRGVVTATDQWYQVTDFREMVVGGAFDAWLAGDPQIYLLVQHGGLPLATTAAQTMTVEQTERGVEVAAQLDRRDPDVQSIATKVKRGDVAGMSVGMVIQEDEWRNNDRDRVIKRAKLIEASITPNPANTATSAEVRARRSYMPDTDTTTDEQPLEARVAALEAQVESLTGLLETVTRQQAMVDNANTRRLIDDAWATEAALLAAKG